MIWRLLRKNISVSQILGYALANLIGLSIVLSALRFYGDVSAAFNGDADDEESLVSKDYLVLSPQVSTLSGVLGHKAVISQDEIDEIAAQPWAMDVGSFRAADFSVSASVDLGGHGISSYLFLESIPDEFIDIKPSKWHFSPQEGTNATVPIILAKDYLNLYNFGFASSRGLPQLGEGSFSAVPIYLRLTGNGRSDVMRAKVVGFSSRLNTIAVPEAFMEWANRRYSGMPETDPSRLIVKVKNPGDPAIARFIEDAGYEVSGDKADSGRAAYFLTLLTGIVVAIGAVISILAFFILMLSIHLLLQKNREKIRQLLLLGYSPAQVAAGYYKLIGAVNAAVLVMAVALMLGASMAWEGRLAVLGIEPSSALPAIAVGIVLMALVTALNFLTVRRLIR